MGSNMVKRLGFDGVVIVGYLVFCFFFFFCMFFTVFISHYYRKFTGRDSEGRHPFEDNLIIRKWTLPAGLSPLEDEELGTSIKSPESPTRIQNEQSSDEDESKEDHNSNDEYTDENENERGDGIDKNDDSDLDGGNNNNCTKIGKDSVVSSILVLQKKLKFSLNKMMDKQALSEEVNYTCCAVCLAPFEKGDLITESYNDNCQHIFHKKCILEWLEKNNQCPLCRETYVVCRPTAPETADATTPAEEVPPEPSPEQPAETTTTTTDPPGRRSRRRARSSYTGLRRYRSSSRRHR